MQKVLQLDCLVVTGDTSSGNFIEGVLRLPVVYAIIPSGQSLTAEG